MAVSQDTMGGSISPRMSVYIGKSHRGVNRANVNHPSAFRSVNPCVSIHRFRMPVASYLYQVHLYHWLESNDYGRFVVDDDL